MEAEDELREFTHMWDGSENWVLSASHWTKVTLTIVFSGESPSVQELAALRRLREEFRAVAAGELKALLAGQHEIRLSRSSGLDTQDKGVLVTGQGPLYLDGFSVQEAREIEERAAQLQVPFVLRSHTESGVSYCPIHYQDGEQWIMLIEDEKLSDRVEREMLKHGVPVVWEVDE